MAYLTPEILKALGLRRRQEEEEPSPYRDLAMGGPVPSTVEPSTTPAPAPNPYRQVGLLPWTTEQPSTAKPDEMIRREIQAPITEGPTGERTLTAPEGTATWTPEQPGRPVSALARRMGLYPGAPAGTYSSLTGTFTPRAEEERRTTLIAEGEARKETQKQNLIADILSTSRSYWGKPTVGPKGEVSGGEVDRRARVGELLTVLKEIYGTSALQNLLSGGVGTGAPAGGPEEGLEQRVTIDAQGRPSVTYVRRTTPTRSAIGEFSVEHQSAEKAATAAGLTGDARRSFIAGEMEKYRRRQAAAQGAGTAAGGASVRLGPAGAVAGAGEPPGMTLAEREAYLKKRGSERAETTQQTVQDNIKAGLNVVRLLDDLERDPGMKTYTYSGRRMAEEGRDILSGLTLGTVGQNTPYIQFRQKLRTAALQAFDFGGKQLTQTEKQFVLETVPSGIERTPQEMQAKISELKKRIHYITAIQAKLANLPRDQYEAEVAKEIGRYGGGSAPVGGPPVGQATKRYNPATGRIEAIP